MTSPVVFVIDDEPSGRQTTHAQLLLEGYELRLIADGRQALQIVRDERPADLVICDVMMPGVDGFAVCRDLKAHPEWRFVPVLLLTARDDSEAIIAGLEAGADDFVSKPVDGAVLRARTRSMLRIRRTYAGLRGGDLAHEPSTRGVSFDRRREEVITKAGLTEREREVLELLLLGRTHEDIALVLGISKRTSRFHQTNLLAKLGADSRIDLLRILL